MSISKLKNFIRSQILNSSFLKKGGAHIKSINVNDLIDLLGLYDHVFFENQLMDKINQRQIKLIFKITNTKPIFKIEESGNTFTISFSTKSFLEFERSDEFPKDRLDCLQTSMEYLIIYLMFLLYDKDYTDKKLLACMFNSVFALKYPKYNVVEIRKIKQIGRFAWHSNSCYIDSLLMVMFASSSDFWIDKILNVDVKKYKYNPKLLCSTQTKLSESEILKLVRQVQIQLIHDVHSLRDTDDNKTCSKLRGLLTQCYPDMKSRRGYEMYNVAELYSILSEMFPETKMKIPISLRGVPKKITRTMFEMFDFNDPRAAEVVEFENSESEMLIFANGGIGAIKDWRTRGFSEVLFDKYRLLGAVILVNRAHYVSVFRDINDKIVYYNDMGPTVKILDKFPTKGVFMEKDGEMPAMLFYERIRY